MQFRISNLFLIAFGIFLAIPAIAEEAPPGDERTHPWLSQECTSEECPGPFFSRKGAYTINGNSIPVELIATGWGYLSVANRRGNFMTRREFEASRAQLAGTAAGEAFDQALRQPGFTEAEADLVVRRALERGDRGSIVRQGARKITPDPFLRGGNAVITGVGRALDVEQGDGLVATRARQLVPKPARDLLQRLTTDTQRPPVGGSIELRLNDTQVHLRGVKPGVELPKYVRAALRNLDEDQVKAYNTAMGQRANRGHAVPKRLSTEVSPELDDGRPNAFLRGLEARLAGTTTPETPSEYGPGSAQARSFRAGVKFASESGLTAMRAKLELTYRAEYVDVRYDPDFNRAKYAAGLMESAKGRTYAGSAAPRRSWFIRGRAGWLKGGVFLAIAPIHAGANTYTMWATRKAYRSRSLGNFTDSGTFIEYNPTGGSMIGRDTVVKWSTAGMIERLVRIGEEEPEKTTGVRPAN